MKITTCENRPLLTECGLKDFDYQIDTYIGCEHYCYYCYVLGQAETDWTKEVLIHDGLATRLEQEIRDISPQTIYMGYHADPYQPCEEEWKQTRNVLELLCNSGFSVSILTKSDLVVRDIDLLSKMKDAAVSVSVAFNEDKDRERFEAKTITTEKRIEALAKLKQSGIKTGAMVCPIIPFITDVKQLLEGLATVADRIWVYGFSALSREEQSWINLQQILSIHYPELAEQIEEILFVKDHDYWEQLREELTVLKQKKNLNLNIHV